MDDFFTKAFENFSDKEAFYKAVFMNTEGEEAAKLRSEYYSKKFKSCGKNLTVGVGVRITNPENITVGDNVLICDDVTIVARGRDSQINIGNPHPDGSILQKQGASV